LKYQNSALYDAHEANFHFDILFSTSLSDASQAWRQKSLAAENIMLRKQLIILNRHRKRAPNLSQWQRLFFAFLTAIINPKRIYKISIAIKPSLLIKFHKALIKRKYSALFSIKSKHKPGPAGPSKELIQAIIEMKQHNPRFGCRRIAMQISNMFGLNIDKDVVWRILAKHYKPSSNDDGPSWLTVIGNMKDSLWSIDFFRCESIQLKSHWVMVLMDQYTRRIIGFAVHPGTLDGISICMLFNKIISGRNLPKYLSSDNDPILQFQRWKANLRILDIEEIKSLLIYRCRILLLNGSLEHVEMKRLIVFSFGTKQTYNANLICFGTISMSIVHIWV